MQRSTKIVATLGPASSSIERLTELVAAGVDVVRINFSHGKPEDHKQRVDILRAAAKVTGRTVGVMADLQGPKLHREICLRAGEHQSRTGFHSGCCLQAWHAGRVGLDYPELIDDVVAGDVLLLDDGRTVFDIEQVVGGDFCRNRHDGRVVQQQRHQQTGVVVFQPRH